MTVIGALSSFREPGEMSLHKRASGDRSIAGEKPTNRELTGHAHRTLEFENRSLDSIVRTAMIYSSRQTLRAPLLAGHGPRNLL